MKYFRRAEEETAKNARGKRNAFSGNTAIAQNYLDVTTEDFLIDVKTAPMKSPKSYRITVDEWENTLELAAQQGKLPAELIQFARHRLVVIEEDTFNAMCSQNEKLQEEFAELAKDYRLLKKKIDKLVKE